jgi:hypothetical protein
VDTGLEAGVREVEAADDIGADGLKLVSLTPVNVGAASLARCVEHMGGLDLQEGRGWRDD